MHLVADVTGARRALRDANQSRIEREGDSRLICFSWALPGAALGDERNCSARYKRGRRMHVMSGSPRISVCLRGERQ